MADEEEEDEHAWRKMLEASWSKVGQKKSSLSSAIASQTSDVRTNTSSSSTATPTHRAGGGSLSSGPSSGSSTVASLSSRLLRSMTSSGAQKASSLSSNNEPNTNDPKLTDESAGTGDKIASTSVDPAPVPGHSPLVEIDDDEGDDAEEEEEEEEQAQEEQGENEEEEGAPDSGNGLDEDRGQLPNTVPAEEAGIVLVESDNEDDENDGTFDAGAEFRKDTDDLPDASCMRVPAASPRSTLAAKCKAPVAKPSSSIPKTGAPSNKVQEYLVDNSSLNASTHGLGYRKSKNIEDLDSSVTATWGSTVRGLDEGDGWLKVGNRYLPMMAQGKKVLIVRTVLARTASRAVYASSPQLADLAKYANSNQKIHPPKAGGTIGGAPKHGIDWKNGKLTKNNTWNAAQKWQNTGSIPSIPRSPEPAAVHTGPIKPFWAQQGDAGKPSWTQQGDAGKSLKRHASNTWSTPPGKKQAQDQLGALDQEGRRYDLKHVVVNFANVGATYGIKVLGRSKEKGQMLFDWEGVRRCLRHLTQELALLPVGVLFEDFKAPDNSQGKVGIPDDIRRMCESIEETPWVSGRNHRSADDEMTIKCAYRRNCRFMDNDNYRDWIREMRSDKCRGWLEKNQELLQIRYFFDSKLGFFDTLEGNVPAGMLAPSGS